MTKQQEAAEWMRATLLREEELYQEDAAMELERLFGDAATYYNDNGNVAIAREVLGIFREIGGENVVWVRQGRYWRMRQDGDEPGREQAD
jgi:hypothetical protein